MKYYCLLPQCSKALKANGSGKLRRLVNTDPQQKDDVNKKETKLLQRHNKHIKGASFAFIFLYGLSVVKGH